jgi:putative ABC transport system substrate-binding protein
MRRREFITLLGGAAVWPAEAHTQQSAAPVIGFISTGSPITFAPLVAAFQRGLSETGYIDGQNVRLEYRWAEGRYDQLPVLAAELVRQQVAVSVASLNRPEGNVTGATFFTTGLEPKWLEFLHELVPNAALVAALVNPNFSEIETQMKDLSMAASAIGLQIVTLRANSESGIEAAFVALAEQRLGALLVASDPFFYSQRDQLVALAARYAVPATFGFREFAVAGGLMSYGTSVAEAFRQTGIYTGKILSGEKPTNLPIMQPTKFELVINLRTAKALGLKVPLTLQVAADEVIE